MNTNRRIKRAGLRALIIAAAFVATALSAGLVYAAATASITAPADQSKHEVGTEVTITAKAGYETPDGTSIFQRKPNYIYFRVSLIDESTSDVHTVFYDCKDYKNTSSLSVKFTPETEGEYLIEVCHDATYVDGTHVDLAETNFEADNSHTIIVQKDLSNAAVAGITNKVYTGAPLTQNPVVSLDGKTLDPATDYDISYSDNTNAEAAVNAGTATMTIKGKGFYKGTVTANFTIQPADFSAAVVRGLVDKTYTGRALTQNPVVTWNGRELAAGTDYDISYQNNTNAGTATLTATGINNFAGSVSKNFTIKQESIWSAGDPSLRNAEYTGSPIIQNLNLWFGRTLVEGEDYIATYKNNVEPGTATVTITGINNFKDSRYRTFSITEKPSSGLKYDITKATIGGITDKVYTGNSITQTPVVTYGGKTLVNGKDYYVTYESATYSGGMNNVDVGKVEVIIHGRGEYKNAVSVMFWITPKQITAGMVTLTPEWFAYNGSLQKPEVSVMYGTMRVSTIEYSLINDGGTETGEYAVTVTAENAIKNYTGSVTKKFVIGAWDAAAAEDLTDKIAEAKAAKGQYLAADQKALQAAISEAEKLFADPNTTTEQMSQALKKLNTLLTDAAKNLAKYNAAVKAAKALPSAAAAQKAILAQKTDKDPSGSSFRILRLRSTKQGKTYNTLTWQKVSGAKHYVIYGSKCGKSNRIKKIATVKKNTYTHKKLKKKTYYKYVVVAVKGTVIGDRTASISRMIHVSTKGSKYGNFKSVTVTKTVLTKAKKLKKGKTLKLGAKAVKASSKARVHVNLRYQSSNNKVATVSGKGVVKGVGKGSCTIFVYAQNGVYKTIPVTVK